MRLLGDQRGQTAVEYAMLLALIGLPSIVLLNLLLSLLAEHYHMVVFLETLPMP